MGNQAASQLSVLSQVLWREREVLELLVFKLEEQRLLLVHGHSRWLCHAARDVEAVIDQIGELELNRAVAVSAAAAALGIADDAKLRSLAEAAPAPWPSVIDEHLSALRRLSGETLGLAESNRALLDEGLEEAHRVMSDRRRRPSTRVLVDLAGFHAAIKTNERVLQPSLVDMVQG